MAHGSRGRWLRVATTGFGMVLCTGLLGCMNTDKPKEKVAAKQPGPGLVGTPTLPGGGGAGAISKTGQPAGQYYGTPGAAVQPAGGFQPGAGVGPTRFGSNGVNTNTSGQSPPYNPAAAPGTPGLISGPTQPGYIPPSMQPVQPGQPVGASGAPSQYLGSGAGAPGGTAYAPPAGDTLLPPLPPPMHTSGGGIETAGGVQPPVPQGIGPMAPSMPPPSSPTGKGQPLTNFVMPGAFGSQ